MSNTEILYHFASVGKSLTILPTWEKWKHLGEITGMLISSPAHPAPVQNKSHSYQVSSGSTPEIETIHPHQYPVHNLRSKLQL